MKRHSFNFGIAATAVVLAGCQSYQRRPLALNGYADQWAERALDIAPIQTYMAALAMTAESPAPFNIEDGLSLREAEAVALHFNPPLRIARAEAEVPLAGATEAGWWPDPVFEGEVLRYLDRGEKTRFRLDGPSLDGIGTEGLETTPVGYRRVEGDFIDDPWIVGAGLSITIPISGRLTAEKDLRWAQYSAAWRRILVAEWELLTRLRTAWRDWSASAERLSITRDYVVRLESIADIAAQLQRAGVLKATEARVLSVELARRRAQLVVAEREAEQLRLALLAMIGLSPAAPIELHPDLAIPSIDVPPDERRAALMRQHPQIKLVEAEYETAEGQLRLEVRRQYPDLDIGPSYSFEEGFSRFGLGFGFPIPLWNRNRQAIAESLAARDAARTRAEATVESVLAELARTELQMASAHRQRAVLLDDVAPLVDRQVEDSRTLLDLGEIDVLLLRDALTAALETRLELLDATRDEARAADELLQMLRPHWFTPKQTNKEEID